MTEKENGSPEATVCNVVGVQAETTEQTKSSTSVIYSKSTETSVQLAKALALLKQRPHTTMELRDRGIMMPAARIHQLRHQYGHDIVTENVTLYDTNGFRHHKCARYRLILAANTEQTGGAA
jgi:hypothetical protein